MIERELQKEKKLVIQELLVLIEDEWGLHLDSETGGEQELGSLSFWNSLNSLVFANLVMEYFKVVVPISAIRVKVTLNQIAAEIISAQRDN